MAMSTLDWLIAAPCIPLAPFVITWWLPWERWVPWGKLPKAVLGPYLLYVSFAAWHFAVGAFFTGVVLLAGLFVSLAAVVEIVDRKS
jgi:hypothetical protein